MMNRSHLLSICALLVLVINRRPGQRGAGEAAPDWALEITPPPPKGGGFDVRLKCDSRHPILQTVSDLIAIDRLLSPAISIGRCNTCNL